jgi:hypothetical protein
MQCTPWRYSNPGSYVLIYAMYMILLSHTFFKVQRITERNLITQI